MGEEQHVTMIDWLKVTDSSDIERCLSKTEFN